MDWVIVNYQKYGETFMVIESEMKKPRSRLASEALFSVVFLKPPLKRLRIKLKMITPYLPMILGFFLR